MRTSKYQESHAKPKQKAHPLTVIITLVLLGIIGFSGFKLYEGFEKYWNDYLADTEVQTEASRDDKTVNWEKLIKTNKDVIGWIYCPDSVIDYPVVKGSNNSTYLSTGLDGKWSGSGTLFADCNTAQPLVDTNTIIYGHHMRDGSMFHDLDLWQGKEFFKKHDTFYFYTPDDNYELQIIACENVAATDISIYGVPFISDEEKTEFLTNVVRDSKIETDVEFTEEDSFVTLSTCAYTFKDARSIVVCKVVKLDKEIEEIEADKPERDPKWKVFIRMVKEIVLEGISDLKA